MPVAKGDSIMQFFEEYLSSRFGALEGTAWGDRTVVFSNFGLTHRVWNDSDEGWSEKVESGEYCRRQQGYNVSVWVYGPYLSAEREAGCTSGRFERFRSIAEDRVKEDGWLGPVDWVPISMALSSGPDFASNQ